MKRRVKNFYQRRKKEIFIFLLLVTVIQIVLVPSNISKTQLSELPIFAFLIVISEVFFIVGLVIMALALEHELGSNPLKWRKHLKHLLKEIPSDRRFWFGFWLNMFGALATGIIGLVAIVVVLPVQSWGILWLPIADIALTLFVRMTAINLRKEAQLSKNL